MEALTANGAYELFAAGAAWFCWSLVVGLLLVTCDRLVVDFAIFLIDLHGDLMPPLLWPPRLLLIQNF